jgi:CelD/BcsL family acetyltransferase involved in cellulose biosynthesis
VAFETATQDGWTETRVMNGRTVRVRELSERDEAAWRALASRAAVPNPLYEPDCVVPAARHQSFGDDIHVVFAEEDGRVFGCIPVRDVSEWRRFPYPFVTTEIRRMVYCGTPLLDGERGTEAMAAMFGALRARRGLAHGRVLVLQEIADGGPVDEALHEAAKAAGVALYRYETWDRPFLARRAEATYNDIHTKKDIRNMGRLRRRLDAAVGGEVRLVDRSDDPSAVEDIIRLEAAGYKAHIGIAMTTVPGETDYFRTMCDRFRKLGRLHVYGLEANGTLCAVVLLVRGDDGLFMLKVGYDERFARSSPGLQLHLDLIGHFHDGLPVQWIDIGTYPGNHTLLRMYPDRKRYGSYFVPLSRNPLDRLAVRAFMAARPLHKRMHDALEARRRARDAPAADAAPAATEAPAGVDAASA